jgi:hypothetical protein
MADDLDLFDFDLELYQRKIDGTPDPAKRQTMQSNHHEIASRVAATDGSAAHRLELRALECQAIADCCADPDARRAHLANIRDDGGPVHQ